MELLPRISRAQAMDVLSSQGNIAGYKAVLVAAYEYGRFMPMLMTAAGTVKAARVLILGAGVAGLQAIATAKRLGAVIEAFDVRPAVKEQVESLGAKFVEVALSEAELKAQESAGGYAREMSDDYKQRQAALIQERAKAADIVITTALIPGRPAPRLVTEETDCGDEAGLGHRRPRGEAGRQLRVQRGRPGGGEERREDRRALEPALRRWPPIRARSTRATCSTSSTCCSTPRRASSRSTGPTKSSPARSSAPTAPLRGADVHGVAVDPLITNLTVFVLAIFVGYHVVWNVTPALHTPLMSVTNAISSVIIVGAILAAGAGGGLGSMLGAVAVVLVAINTFGGFLVTERMLEMFKKKEPKK